MKTSHKLPKHYQNNPFFVATDGLDLLFKKAQSVGITLAIIAGLGLVGSIPTYFLPSGSQGDQSSPPTTSTPNDMGFPAELIGVIVGIGLVVLLIVLFISIVARGLSDYTSARLARGKATNLSEALRAVMSHFWSYTWMLVVVGVKTLLWSLLLIVPGIVMSFRYSLAGVSFFDKSLRGNAASKHSADITKGVWLTTFASQSLLNLLTFSVIQPLLAPGTNAILYRQFVDLKGDKPKAHVVSWLTLVLPIVLTLVLGLLVGLLIWALINYSSTAP